MNNDHIAIAMIIWLSLLLLLLFVRKTQIRKALLALLIAQFFSWPLTMMFVYFHLQFNPVRFFPYATKSTFLMAFIFHPAVFIVYYLRYPLQSPLPRRMFFSLILPGFAVCAQGLAGQYTNLIYLPNPWVLVVLFLILTILYQVLRKYVDWFFKKMSDPLER
ncbi:hypothetical protein PAESOLCIP111_01081 [Paenibacillus solanacearum]|uniref:Uncharacterized protein n=1 Tax=Paenibacillus solanacearum TaxID=2048548 RepID=A0A916JW89_9BACL|nr:CBO0543 family protein [Paenibacillus solanacearum]CAG7608618.1 hypothetical protein PAESOLCIP111_01081 [Paenibacillus solanacearum]